MDEYVSISETKQMLETNGIKDIFQRFSDKSETLKCKYHRVTNEFPMSVSNLIKYGYLDVDGDITPKMIKKESESEGDSVVGWGWNYPTFLPPLSKLSIQIILY